MPDGQEKLNTCLFRSAEELVQVIHRCSCQGGNYETKDFYCNKKQLLGVTAETCKDCELYQSK